MSNRSTNNVSSQSNRRRRDIPAMIFGLIFIGVAGWYVIGGDDRFDLASAGWITAGLLILLGVAGLASALRNARE